MHQFSPRSLPGRRTRSELQGSISLLIVLLAGGCTNMDTIDRRIERAVLQRSEALGGGTPAPRFRQSAMGNTNSPGQADKTPGSINPEASDMAYRGAEASREVISRLDQYAQRIATAEPIDLREVLRLSQLSARDYINAEEEYLLAAIRLLIERHRWSPRVFDEISATVSGEADRGDYTTALRVMNELRVTQRLPYGGEVEARLITEATQQLTEIVGDRYEQASRLVIGANIPLLRNAGLIAQEELIQSERELVYAARDFENFRRDFFVDIASSYFDLVAQRAVIYNQERRLESVQRFYEQTQALVEAGREPPFQSRNIEQNVLTSRNALINSRESYILALDQFKVRLGLPVEMPLSIRPVTFDLDDPDVSVVEASELALRYRLDYQNEADRVDDARRIVANSRNQLLPDLNVLASATVNTDVDNSVVGIPLRGDETDYIAGVTFGLPLDREIERLQLRQSIVGLQQRQRSLEQFRDNLILEARQSVREIDRARFSVRLQDQAVRINELRLEEIRIKADEIDPQTRLDAENELLQSRNDLDQAVRDLRVAILEYLVRTGQLRVGTQGELKPLRGLDVRFIEAEVVPGADALPPDNPPQPPPADPP